MEFIPVAEDINEQAVFDIQGVIFGCNVLLLSPLNIELFRLKTACILECAKEFNTDLDSTKFVYVKLL